MLHWAAYIALSFEENISSLLLSEGKKAFNGSGLEVVWHSEEYIHLTLIFFEWLRSEEVNTVSSIIKQHKEAFSSLVLSSNGDCRLLGWQKEYKYLTLSMEPQEDLERLQIQLKNDLHEAGLKPKAQPFYPHISLGLVYPDCEITHDFHINKLPDITSFRLILLESTPSSKVLSENV